MMDGKGELSYANGDHYIGYFKRNKMNGSGILTKVNKNMKYIGIWEDNNLVKRLKDPNDIDVIFRNMAL